MKPQRKPYYNQKKSETGVKTAARLKNSIDCIVPNLIVYPVFGYKNNVSAVFLAKHLSE